jgi:citrate synthase
VTRVDQHGIDNQPEFIDAQAAIRLLNVRRPTLYAYVSRGMVRTRPGVKRAPGRGGRPNLYCRADLLRLKARHDARAGHGVVAAGALRWGEPVLDSALTEITPAGPRYRGRDAVALARAGTRFEAVAELLWTGARVAGPRWPAPAATRLRGLECVPRGTPPLPSLLAALPLYALHDRDRRPRAEALEIDRARLLVRALPSLAALGAGARRVAAARAADTMAQATAAALGASGARAATAAWAIERALVLSADHELNVSTFAARIAASAGADLYACATAALATLTGPRHGGVCDRVEALVAEAETPRRARELVRARLGRGEDVPGFAHPFYPAGDPRGALLLETARTLERSPSLRVLEAVVAAMPEPPALDTGLVAIALALGLPSGSAAALFALGRAAGWVAHVLEQRRDDVLLRPRARYVGPHPPER